MDIETALTPTSSLVLVYIFIDIVEQTGLGRELDLTPARRVAAYNWAASQPSRRAPRVVGAISTFEAVR